MAIFVLGDRRKWPLSFLLSHNDNAVIHNIKYSDRNIHQKVEVLNETVNVTKQQGSQHLLKYVCIIANNMLTAAVYKWGAFKTRNGEMTKTIYK